MPASEFVHLVISMIIETYVSGNFAWWQQQSLYLSKHTKGRLYEVRLA